MRIAVNRVSNWIFVTGAPRAGTTFVGKVLSQPWSVDYLHEPFNLGLADVAGMGRFAYVDGTMTEEQARRLDQASERLMDYDFEVTAHIPDVDAWHRRLAKRIIGGRGAVYLRIAKVNVLHTAAVIKDPTASFLGAYLQSRFSVKPVVVIKHPVVLAASLKRLDWLPSPHWFEQQSLIEDVFGGDRDRMLGDADWSDPVDAAAAHWRIVHAVQLRQASEAESSGRRPWIIVQHEQLSADPVRHFRTLYEDLGLPWSERVKRKIVGLTGAGRADARDGRVQDLKRDSASIFELRRNQLTPAERRRVYDLTRDVASQLYDRSSFDID